MNDLKNILLEEKFIIRGKSYNKLGGQMLYPKIGECILGELRGVVLGDPNEKVVLGDPKEKVVLGDPKEDVVLGDPKGVFEVSLPRFPKCWLERVQGK